MKISITCFIVDRLNQLFAWNFWYTAAGKVCDTGTASRTHWGMPPDVIRTRTTKQLPLKQPGPMADGLYPVFVNKNIDSLRSDA